MDENQTNQNLNQNPVQPVQPQPGQVQQSVQQTVQNTQQVQQSVQQQPVQNQQQVQQQSVQGQAQSAQQPSVSMQIQQLLVQQQQYQKQYNDLVDYVKKTPNLPIEQVNQIKAQLDQLNALFVQGKQQLQALGYSQVQVQKPAEVKKGSVANFSLKKVAIGCVVVLVLIFAGFFLTLSSLIKNPNALGGIGVDAGTAKVLLQAFTGLIFGSVILIMLGVIISNIYRLITVKNQGKGKFVRRLIGGVLGAGAMGAAMGLIFGEIGKIVIEVEHIDYDAVQPYLVGRVENEGIDEFAYPYKNGGKESIGEQYPLIAPSEMAFRYRLNEIVKLAQLPAGYEIVEVKLLCGDKDETVLERYGNNDIRFHGTCLYPEKGTYTYGIEVVYYNTDSKARESRTYPLKSLDFTSEVKISKNSSNGEFVLGKAPAKITVDSTQVFRDFSTKGYEVEWDMDGDFENDREGQVYFDYSYKVPQVYYVTYRFPEIKGNVRYRFPVRVEQSDVPVCEVNIEKFPLTSSKFQISTDFIDGTLPSTISSYKYTIINRSTNQTLDEKKNEGQKIVYKFPSKGNYVVVVDYVTVDSKQGQCESELIQLEKEEYSVDYTLQEKDSESGRFKDVCTSTSSEKNYCTEIKGEKVPQTYQLKVKGITPSTENTTYGVYFENENSEENTHPLMEDNSIYEFTVLDEGNYELRIVISDPTSGIDDTTKIIKITAEKPDIVGVVTVTSSESDAKERKPVSEGFSPLTVILDASKTEINIPGDEIIYFTWDFGDGQVKTNQQNGVVSHTYSYDYAKENGIFTPTVTIKTLQGQTKVISGPTLLVKKQLVEADVRSISHPSGQAPVNNLVEFMVEFDGLPEKMSRDFGDGSSIQTCQGRTCTEVRHSYSKPGTYVVRVSLDFDEIQQVEESMTFKVY